MPIVSDYPEHGLRIAIERPATGGPPWHYAGAAFTPTERFELRVEVSESAEVSVEVAQSAPADLAEKVRLIVRTVAKQAKSEGISAPARKIVRWRGEK